MSKTYSALFMICLASSMIMSSCLRSEDCISNVFENEDLLMDIEIDGRHLFISDSTDNYILPLLRYEIDSTREDTLIFYFDCRYYAEDEKEFISLTVVKHADFSEVINYGSGLLNYVNFESMIEVGDFEYFDRCTTLVDYAVSLRYLANDSTEYWVDQSPGNPEDFYFHVDNYVNNKNMNCYSQNIEWITFTGTFGCRMVDREREDTIVITNGAYRAAIAQFHYGI